MRADEQRGQAVADDPVCPRAIRDGVAPQRTSIRSEKRTEADSQDAQERQERRAPGAWPRPPQPCHGEERDGYECELLGQDGCGQRGGRPAVAPPQEQPECEQQEQQRRRVGGAEPGRALGDRVRGGDDSESQPNFQRAGEHERNTEHPERCEHRQPADVVPRRRQNAPGRAKQCDAGEVREVVQGHGRLPRRRARAAIEAVEALEAGSGVVVAVRGSPVEHQLAGEFDLVRRVVHVEPRLARLSKSHLKGYRRDEERRDHQDRRRHEHPWTPATHEARGHRERHYPHAGEHRDRTQHAEVPVGVREPDEESERAVGHRSPGTERPWVGAEKPDVEDDHAGQRADHDPCPSGREARAGGAAGPHGALERVPANATKKPLNDM